MINKSRIIVTGQKELLAKLRRLGDPSKMRRVLRKATNAGATPMVKAVRKRWPRLTGFSAKSVTKKIYKTKDGYNAIVGIDRKASAPGYGSAVTHIPANIDHLVELGFKHADGTQVPAFAPLRKGYEDAKDQAMAAYERKCKEGIEQEAK